MHNLPGLTATLSARSVYIGGSGSHNELHSVARPTSNLPCLADTVYLARFTRSKQLVYSSRKLTERRLPQLRASLSEAQSVFLEEDSGTPALRYTTLCWRSFDMKNVVMEVCLPF